MAYSRCIICGKAKRTASVVDDFTCLGCKIYNVVYNSTSSIPDYIKQPDRPSILDYEKHAACIKKDVIEVKNVENIPAACTKSPNNIPAACNNKTEYNNKYNKENYKTIRITNKAYNKLVETKTKHNLESYSEAIEFLANDR